jgi:hypothetical protein
MTLTKSHAYWLVILLIAAADIWSVAITSLALLLHDEVPGTMGFLGPFGVGMLLASAAALASLIVVKERPFLRMILFALPSLLSLLWYLGVLQ